MSSPRKSSRQPSSQASTPKATRRTAASSSVAAPSSPAGGDGLVSSPLFYQASSSPAPSRQSRLREVEASSPPSGNMTSSPAPMGTPRARYMQAMDVSSPLQYQSSPAKVAAKNLYRSRSALSSDPLGPDGSNELTPRASRRGDINASEIFSPRNRRLFTHPNGEPAGARDSDAPTFSAAGQTSETGEETVRVIWGTNINIQDAQSSFRGFLQDYKRKYRMIANGETPEAGVGNEKVYAEMLKQMKQLGLSNLNLDIKNLLAYPPTKKLYYQLQNYPQEIIPIMDQTIKDCMVAMLTEQGASQDVLQETEAIVYKVRPFNLEKTANMRDLNPADIDKMISIKGLVIRTTPVIPDMKEAFFRCQVCNHTVTVEIDRGKIAEPVRCPRKVCNSPNSMQIVHNRSEFADKQIIKLQETPDAVPDGQTPHSVSLLVYDELVDVCKAGDRIEVTGIFRSVPVRINPRQRTIKSLFKTYVDGLHIQKVDKRRLGLDVTTLEGDVAEQVAADVEEVRKITDEEVTKIKELATRYDVYEVLSRSLAPSIYEMDDVKKGVLLQLFGGTNKTFEKGGAPRYRGDINILLCGDPSTSKSQLLQYVHKIAPRGIYTSGKGSSAVGLTAYVTRDPESRQLVLESGALVLSDGGICCIDEFDKMSESTRSVLHEVMEQQTVSIAKAGIITTLNARSSILASANPIGSKYNPNLPVPQNIDLPPTLLSRFDLVYLILDKVDEKADRQLARHLVGMYLEDRPENAAGAREILPIEFLTTYISYARQNIQPVISEEASAELVRAYVELRKLGEDVRAAERRITATTRQLESMIRLSEAHAKMRLSSTVDLDDVKEAVRLIKSAIKESATDPITGRIDMDLLGGFGVSERRRKGDLKTAIVNLMDELTRQGGGVRYGDLLRRLGEQSSIPTEPGEFAEALRALEQEGQVTVSGGEGAKRMIRRVTGV